MEIFRIEHLSFSYPESREYALRDICLSLRKGEFFVLCGHSGCGKSTLLRHLKPVLTPSGEVQGEIYFHDEPLSELDDRRAAASIGYVMQSPEHQVVTDKVWHELAFGLESLGMDTPSIRRRTAEMAAFFGMESWYYKKVSELSGGQKQLLCLASVMAMQPEILILDEPTAQLDPIAASEFLAALGKINRELGTTILLSEHRLEEALTLADRAAVMERGSILCEGTVTEIGRHLREKKSAMFSAMPCAMRVWGSVETALPCPVTVNEGRCFLAEYTSVHPICALPERPRPAETGEECLWAEEAWFRYERDLPDTVRGLSFSARRGELFCILGGNGSGKTTTLKLLSGAKKPYRGEIRRAGRTALLPQDPQTVFLKNTVEEDLTALLREQKLSPAETGERLREMAALCEITELLQRHPYDLSGGEQQRAALAKILLLAPDILLLDEPTKGLDIPFKETLAEILQKLKNSGVCIVMVSHDVEFCARYADHCGLFFDGGLVTVSEPTPFFSGNSFYTTAANRMAREIEPEAVTAEDVIALIGGTGSPPAPVTEKAVLHAPAETKPETLRELPRWRKLCAAVCGAGALAVLLYTAGTGGLRELTTAAGLTALGGEQLALYGGFVLLLALMGVFLGRRSEKTVSLIQMPREERRIPRRTVCAAVMILLLVPLTLFAGVAFLSRKQYYVTALAVLLECMLPFFLIFEGRKPKARELVIIATLCALAVAGRAAFFMLPQFKPVMALTIIAGVAFGGETGFLVGSVSMLVSNVLFSQGPWTPWQMFAMGLSGFLAGVLYKKGWLRRSRISLCIFGTLCAFIIYGGLMNPASLLIWSAESLNGKMILSSYVTGFPVDAVHAAATALFLWFGAEPMLEKLDRIKTKYGLL